MGATGTGGSGAARAAVAAWMEEPCPHPHPRGEVSTFKYTCPDCLLAFAAAQRAEEREECAQVAVGIGWIGTDMKYPRGKIVTETAAEIVKAIRARREGSGGAK
jgi:hypothetical protein